jgi:hypothetical protein
MPEKIEEYIPSENEARVAEVMMSDKERRKSEIRLKYWEQPRPEWGDFAGDSIDENHERRKPTEEEERFMENSLLELSNLFADSGLNWHLDGAINISLMKGEFIGVHKDVDVSVEAGELSKLDAHIFKKGYGLFFSYLPDGSEEKILRRTSADGLRQVQNEQLLIVAIDENGKIVLDRNLNFIDLHLINRNKDGKPIDRQGIILPEDWFVPRKMIYKSRKINTSCPAKVAYYKLKTGREYDIVDLYKLAEIGNLRGDDIDQIEIIFKDDAKVIRSLVMKMSLEISQNIRPNTSPEEIFSVLEKLPELKQGIKYQRSLFEKLSHEIAKSDNKSANYIYELFIATFDLEEKNKQRKDNIEKLKNSIIPQN